MILSLLVSWVACVAAFFIFSLTPIASAQNWQAVVLIGTAWWIFGLLIKPLLKFILFPFNIISFGVIGGIIEYITIWLLFWLVPTYSLYDFTLFGFLVSGWLLIFVAALCVAITQRLLLAFLKRII